MSHKTEAIQVARRAESEVRSLIERATSEGLYQEIVDLAAFAQGLAELRARLGDTAEKIGNSVDPSSGSRKKIKPPGRSSRARRTGHKKLSAVRRLTTELEDNEYPRFLKDQDKLVKVGWSEREASTYEHRAPLEVVRVVIQKIEMLTKRSDTFRMEDVLPVEIAGNGVPPYQAYLALAWLRKSGLVDRSNKNSYVTKNSDGLLKSLDRLWKSLPTVASEHKETVRE